MKKSIQSLFLLFFSVTLAMSRCVSVPTSVLSSPTSTLMPKPTSTATLTATTTAVPSPTAVVPVWNVIMQIDSPLVFEERRYGYSYNYEEIPGTSIVPNTTTRWSVDMQVNELPGATGGETSTGLFLEAYREDGQEVLRLELIYANGYWNFGYSGSSTKSQYSQRFQNLDVPTQHFQIILDQDHNLVLENQDGFLKGLRGAKLLDGAELIKASLLIGPRRQITVPKLIIEQLQVPSTLMESAISLEKPYTEGFEALDPSQPTEISPFIFPELSDRFGLFNDSWKGGTGTYTSWAVDSSRAKSGQIALNAIPTGNPATKGMVPLTMASLQPIFDVAGHHTVTLKLWFNSTSNPSVRRIHNCESDLAVYVKLDTGPWMGNRVICGEHKSESQGWQNVSMDFDVSGKSTIRFAFVYEVQDSKNADPTAYFLIDDLEIVAK